MAALSAAVFYINRMLRVTEGVLYSSAAAGLVAMVLAYETPHQYLCGGLAGFRRDSVRSWASVGGKLSFDTSPTSIGALGTGAGLLVNWLSIAVFGGQSDWPDPWLPLAICAALLMPPRFASR